MVWSDIDTRKATTWYLCIGPTTQPLHQGAENAGKTRTEELFAKWSTKSLGCGKQGRRSDSQEGGFSLSHLQSRNNDSTTTIAYSDACCVQNCVRSCMVKLENCGKFFIAV